MDTHAITDLKKLLGPDAVLHRPEELLLYEYDGSVENARPNCVVFPRNTKDVVGIVQIANRYRNADHRPWRRHGPFRRSARSPRRHSHSFFAHESHPGN